MPPYKKRVKFANSRSPIPHKKRTINSEESYANIVLHYLSKLKGLFQLPSSKDSERNVIRYASKENLDREFSSLEDCKPILKKDDSEKRQKAYDIVQAALQYGCANNIIENAGYYFIFKNNKHSDRKPERGTPVRRPTPGPDYFRCASCKNLSKYKDRHFKKRRLSSNRRSRSTRRKKSNTSLDNYCSKCYTRMKSNRK